MLTLTQITLHKVIYVDVSMWSEGPHANLSEHTGGPMDHLYANSCAHWSFRTNVHTRSEHTLALKEQVCASY